MMSRGHVNSCALCHNTPYRDGGAGATMAKNGGDGRNTPHMFGAGLVEMIGQQIRLEALAVADDNRDGWISFEEAKGKRCVLYNLPEGVEGGRAEIDYGSFEDLDGDGKPDLNPLFSIIYVDKDGKRLAKAKDLRSPGVAGYTFEVQCFGFGHLAEPGNPPVSTTLRSFIATPFDIHMGLQAFDPTTLDDPDGRGFSKVSNAGCQQCVTAAGKDRGRRRGPTGVSLDDPDGDGYCEEISEGDLDVAEWYLLNHPAPARGEVTPDVRRGETLFKQVGCAACHVPDWHLHAADPDAKDYTRRYAGDRRFFELQVAYNEKAERLEGKLVYLADRKGGLWLPRRRRVHGAGHLHRLQIPRRGRGLLPGAVRRRRSSGSGGPRRSGASGPRRPTATTGPACRFNDVIRRHGGEALEARKAYTALGPEDRRRVLDFLESLVLYQTDRLPCDLDGDGVIAEHFVVAGMDTGYERFNPEWLFNTPGKIEGSVLNPDRERVTSFALTNVRAAYGLDLKYLKDSDGDGFPDVIDPAPFWPGYRDGEH